MTVDDSVEKVENEADEEESAVGEVPIPESCVLCIRQGTSTIQQEIRVARTTKVTTNPEATAKRKFAWKAGKKESRKSKNRAFA
ncbi:hypothetical protein M405DRAFT_868688 [Rhizopogon salebrosus TDB-379]|nr:hypothetical protein M405DRAFT_868688 [Rhizopogon salebrosus TDB-379]